MTKDLSDLLSKMSANKLSILEPLNDQQKLVAINYKGPSFVTAGAGSGKTATIVRRAAFMIEDGVAPESILLFTFTKKAANEIKDRVVSVIGEAATTMTVSTYHSFCCKVLRRHYRSVGLKKNFTIMDDDDKTAAINLVLRNSGLAEQAEQFDIDTRVFGDRISKYKEHYLFPTEAVALAAREGDELDVLAANIYKEYQKKIRESNSVDFDDLIMYVTWILENKPMIKRELLDKYRYITADECQDSSAADIRFISNLISEETLNICFVGDLNQSKIILLC